MPIGLTELICVTRAKPIEGRKRRRNFQVRLDYDGCCADFLPRTAGVLSEGRAGFKYDVVNAVLAAGADDVVDAIARAEAVSKVRGSQDFESISVAFKRIKNILRQARKLGSKSVPRHRCEGFMKRGEENWRPRFANAVETSKRFARKDDYERLSWRFRSCGPRGSFFRPGHGHGGG